jgi:hypothetical protein
MTFARLLLTLLLSVAGCSHTAVAGDQSAKAAWQKVTLGASGSSYPFALYSNYPLEAVPKTIEAVVIIQHGLLRNGDVYFADARKLLAESGADASATLIVAPQFFATVDADKAGDRSIPLWSRGGWMEGAESIEGTKNVSSFRVYDDLFAWLADRSRFPALKRIVLAGHSGGGQVVQRYAILNHVDARIRAADIDLRYVVANPSSYLYFDDKRPQSTGYAPYDAARCPDFNRYKYGFEGPVPYAQGASPDRLFATYAARDVVYLLGTADNDPKHPALDKRCPAEAQGRTRIERGHAYVRYERALAGKTIRLAHHAYDVTGIGHDQAGMFGSQCGRRAIFGTDRAGANIAECVEITNEKN